MYIYNILRLPYAFRGVWCPSAVLRHRYLNPISELSLSAGYQSLPNIWGKNAFFSIFNSECPDHLLKATSPSEFSFSHILYFIFL